MLLTLALEQSAGGESPAELQALFDQRENVLAELESLRLDTPALEILIRVQEVERRLMGNMCDGRALMLRQFSDGQAVRKAATAYRRQNPTGSAGFDDHR